MAAGVEGGCKGYLLADCEIEREISMPLNL